MLAPPALPSLRVAVTGEVRGIVFSEKGAVVATPPPRSTPITTVGSPPFEVRIHLESAMAWQLEAHESCKPASMAAPGLPFQQGEMSRTPFTCYRPNLGPHVAFRAPLSPRDREVQVVGYGLRRSPFRRTRVKKARESVNASGWDRLGMWLGRRGARTQRTAG